VSEKKTNPTTQLAECGCNNIDALTCKVQQTINDLRQRLAAAELQNAQLRRAQSELATMRSHDQAASMRDRQARQVERLGSQLSEYRLRNSEERFRSVMEHIPGVAVQGYSLDGTVLFWNKASEHLYGFTAAEALGRNLLDLIIPPDMRAEVADAMRQMAQTNEPIPAGELMLRHKDGSSVPVFSSHALIHPLGRPPEMFCLDIDLTERKQAEAALLQSEAHNLALIHAIPDILFTNSADGTFLSVHAPDPGLLYAPPEAILHRKVADVLPSTVATLLMSGIEMALSTRTAQEVNYSLDLQGSEQYFEARIVPSGLNSTISIVRNVTERYRFESALHESEARYRTMVEWSPDPVGVHINAIIVYVNPAAIKLFGADSAADLIGTSILDRVHPDYLAVQMERRARTERGESLSSVEQKFLRLDGTPIDVEVLGTSIVYDGKPAVYTIARDISERKRALAALEESQARYRSMMDWFPEPVIAHQDGKVIYVNQAAVTMFGYRSERAFLGKNVTNLMHPDYHALARERTDKRLQGLEVSPTVEYPLYTRTGEPLDVEVRSASLVLFNGERASVSLLRDNTESKRAAAALRESEARYRTMMDWIPDAVVVHRKGVVLYANPTAIRLINVPTLEDVVGKRLTEVIHPDLLPIQPPLPPNPEDGQPAREYRFRRPDGQDFYAEIRAVQIIFDGSAAIMSLVHDTTERRLAELAMRKAAEEQISAVSARMAALDEADASQAVRQTFVNVVAHELRTPMQMVITAVDLIEMLVAQNNTSDLKNPMGRIRLAVEMMRTQLSDIAEFARTSDPRLSIRMKPLTLSDIARRVTETYSPAATDKGLQFAVTVTPDKPPNVLGDPMRISQVIGNLLDNAIKYSDTGSIHVTLEVNDQGLLVRVSDEGVGIEESDYAVVTQPFRRGRNVPKETPGSGLGLTIVNKLVELMGGRLEIARANPHGTVVSAYLPLPRGSRPG